MNKEKIECNLGNYIIRSGNDGMGYFRVTTANPFIEFKVYSETFLSKLIDQYLLGGKNEIDLKVLLFQLNSMFYVCTANDDSLLTLVYIYIDQLNKNMEVVGDISIAQAKASYYVRKTLEDMANNNFKVKDK